MGSIGLASLRIGDLFYFSALNQRFDRALYVKSEIPKRLKYFVFGNGFTPFQVEDLHDGPGKTKRIRVAFRVSVSDRGQVRDQSNQLHQSRLNALPLGLKFFQLRLCVRKRLEHVLFHDRTKLYARWASSVNNGFKKSTCRSLSHTSFSLFASFAGFMKRAKAPLALSNSASWVANLSKYTD